MSLNPNLETLSMNSALCLWLADVEDALERMIRGVFRFTFQRLPELAYRLMIETIGPVAVRLMRVAFFLCVWLAVVFGPGILVLPLSAPASLAHVVMSWTCVAMIGSVWGLYYLRKKNRIIAAQNEAADRGPFRRDAFLSRS
jgi:hypothetical protein